MDIFTVREMRIAGIAIATTLVALSVAETGGQLSLNIIRAALAALGLGLVLFAGRFRVQA